MVGMGGGGAPGSEGASLLFLLVDGVMAASCFWKSRVR